MKYVVMECHPGYAVLLDEEGRFVKAANFHYQVGDTIEDPVFMKEPAPKKSVSFRAAMSMAAAAACFLMMLGGYYQNYMRAETAIYLNINPSVCMELNRQGQVVRLRGANADGEKLLENYSRSSNDRLVVMDELIDRAIDMGFLSEGGMVTIDIDAPDNVYFQQYGMEFRTNLTEYLESKLSVEIHIVEHNIEEPEFSSEVPSEEKTVCPETTEEPEAFEEQKPSEDAPVPAIPVPESQPESSVQPEKESVPEASDYGTDYETDEESWPDEDYWSDEEGSSDEESSDYGADHESSDYE